MLFIFSFCFVFFYMILGFMFLYTFFVESFMFDYYLFDWAGLVFSFTLVVDYLSVGFFCCVSFISGVVFFYSIFYMSGNVMLRRFSWLVFLFVISMMLLVFSGNFLLVMVGWDGLGLISFCLVIFYNNSFSMDSGLVTVFSNRVGDVFFLLSFVFFFAYGSFTWDSFSFVTELLFLVFVFIGAITKSAQIPFSAWLPAAMAAPTPVSSLVHSSTLVTAGVYVLIRFNYLFTFFFSVFKFFFLLTMIMAGFCAFVEGDLKKIVAMSTLSQLGMMMFILSIGGWILSFIHMMIHAFFKSMLFLSTGSLMSQKAGSQDSRLYGGGVYFFSSFVFFVVSCLCLAGFPFLLGFYSKDFIISSSSFFEGIMVYYIFLGGCVFTVVYSIRLILSSVKLFYKYSSFFSFFESLNFFLFSLGLFFNCWLTGGVIYWMLLTKMIFFFTFFDLFLGIFVMMAGIVFYMMIKLIFVVFFKLASILFLRWFASSGSSFSMDFYSSYSWEVSWMEVVGGSGVYNKLSSLSYLFRLFEIAGLGIMILIFIFFFIFIFV